jgi:hypothetical protein
MIMSLISTLKGSPFYSAACHRPNAPRQNQNNAKSNKLGDKELITMGDVRAVLHTLVSDVLSGRITMAESVPLRKKATNRLKQIGQLVKDRNRNREELKSIMK